MAGVVDVSEGVMERVKDLDLVTITEGGYCSMW